MKVPLPVIALCSVLALAGCGAASGDSAKPTTTGPSGLVRAEPTVRVPKGSPPKHLVVKDLRTGTGPPVKAGDELVVEYIGVSWDDRQFTNSWERSKPFVVPLDRHSRFVDPSWEMGLKGMRLGGRRELLVPPAARHAPPGTPPSDTIVYVIDLISVNGK